MVKTTWSELIKEGRKNQSNKQINILDKDDIETVLATMDFFGADNTDLTQTLFDLKTAKYRVFDWLAMGIGGRIRKKTALRVLIYAFRTAGYNEVKFIENLRVNDYQIMTEWEKVILN